MISFLFWNINKKKQEVAPHVANIARAYSIDVLLLAECPGDLAPLMDALNALDGGLYHCPEFTEAKVRLVSRLPKGSVAPSFTNLGKDMTIWTIRASRRPRIFLAAVHLMSKAGGNTPGAQQTRATTLAQEIAKFEDREGCTDTLLVGDLNMNPYEAGVVLVTGLHALMTKSLAGRPERKHMGESYRRFYNPMWGLYGDGTPGPAGTHYWESSMIENHHWQMFDQVLLRPSLMDMLRSVQILASDGRCSLLNKDDVASKMHLSDHLPIFFQLVV